MANVIRAVPPCALEFLRRHEALVPFVYDDALAPPRPVQPGAAVRGRLTAGYGHTHGLAPGMAVSEALAEQWLAEDAHHDGAMTVCLHGGEAVGQLTDNQYAALISFAFNTGGGPDSGSGEWTIWRRLRAGQFDQVPIELMRFTRTRRNGQLVECPGLVARRIAERALWSTPDAGEDHQSAPVDASRPSAVEAAPIAAPIPVPVDPDPPQRSKTLIASAVTVIATVPPAVQEVSNAMQPYASQSSLVAQIIGWLAVIAALSAGATAAFYAWHKHKARAV